MSGNTTINQGKPARSSGLFKRVVLATLGVFFVGLAAVGVVLPGIPTVGPLILASLMFTKSFPALEQKLIRNRFFARYLHYLDGSTEMPVRAKIITVVIMWLSIGVSITVFQLSGTNSWWLSSIMVLAGIVGTVFIWRYGKRGDQIGNEKA